MLSIIIPAWNEEKCLPVLLECIKKQTYKDYEIVIADADSSDKTIYIAKKYGCKIVKGGFPAKGRNSGAKVAKGGIFIFLDADVKIEKDFLRKAVKELSEKKLDCAGTYLKPQANNLTDSVFLEVFNIWIRMMQHIFPHAVGSAIFCRKSLHKKIKGFDESITLAEDMDYVKRASKSGKFRILKTVFLSYSMRRYEAEGRLKVIAKILMAGIYRVFFGEMKTDIFNYDLRYRK